MIAGLIQNTSLNYRDVEDLTVAELEGLYDGIRLSYWLIVFSDIGVRPNFNRLVIVYPALEAIVYKFCGNLTSIKIKFAISQQNKATNTYILIASAIIDNYTFNS